MPTPFSWVLDLNTAFKDAGSRKYGEPPYGHAELSPLNSFSKKVDLDARTALEQLRKKGFQVTDGKQTLKAQNITAESTEPLRDIAARQGMDPSELYGVIRSAVQSLGHSE